MELRIKASDQTSQELERLLEAQGIPFERMEHEGVDAVQVIEFIINWAPPVLALIGAIVDLLKKLGKDKQAIVTVDLADE
ncbi:hypothetical protein [Rhizobium ruizarguesonis]|uniref:hypothetical protein n=1 Tax=Rhizobium ruizarguesonis TaxID=2081791 RepID=UPI0010310A57|nr:hypothetical protein [Rhizobium ruizarguesonis]TBA50491.1 hypothetical protein ELH63_23860 [Rhizobium ruizarguesonis]